MIGQGPESTIRRNAECVCGDSVTSVTLCWVRTYDVNRAPPYLAPLYLRLKDDGGLVAYYLPASVPRGPTKQKVRRTSPYVQMINVASRQAIMRTSTLSRLWSIIISEEGSVYWNVSFFFGWWGFGRGLPWFDHLVESTVSDSQITGRR